MTIFTNFKTYTPDEPAFPGLDVLYLKCDEGYDWYDCQKHFEEGKQKVMFDADGIINSVADDISGFFPENSSVADVDSLPKDFTINRTHVYNVKTGKVVKRKYSTEEVKTQVDNQVKALMSSALSSVSPLQLAVKYEMATEEEKLALEAWEKYIVNLNRVSSQEGYPSKVEWPQAPTA